MKYVFVGDIHGKIDVVNKALDEDGTIIFVGDLVDSFDRSVGEQERCVKTVLDAIDAGKAECIFGNHELSYLMPTTHRCSGYKNTMDMVLMQYRADILAKFKPAILLGDEACPNWFITHAGMHPIVFADYIASNQPIEEWAAPNEATNRGSAAHWIGQARGGYQKVGGIYWCDFNDEFKPVDGINQIFGHTRHKATGIRTLHSDLSENYCIDCLDSKAEFLRLDL
jgi:hypothetical protein